MCSLLCAHNDCVSITGQLGRGDTVNIGDNATEINFHLLPIDLGTSFIVKQFAGGSNRGHHCAASIDGLLKCFGNNAYGVCSRCTRCSQHTANLFTKGQLGYGDTDNRGCRPGEMGANLTYVDLGDGFVVESVSLGEGHSCALSTNCSVKCWGAGNQGRLGIDSNAHRLTLC